MKAAVVYRRPNLQVGCISRVKEIIANIYSHRNFLNQLFHTLTATVYEFTLIYSGYEPLLSFYAIVPKGADILKLHAPINKVHTKT